MAELTEKTFQELINEQKKTTQALGQASILQKETVEGVEKDSSIKRERSDAELKADNVRREKALARLNKRMGVFGAVKNTFGKLSKFFSNKSLVPKV